MASQYGLVGLRIIQYMQMITVLICMVNRREFFLPEVEVFGVRNDLEVMSSAIGVAGERGFLKSGRGEYLRISGERASSYA
jgi:hypothetical protein